MPDTPDSYGDRKVRIQEQETLAKFRSFLRLDRFKVDFPKYELGKYFKDQERVNLHRNDAVAGILHIVGSGPHEGKQALLLVEQFRFSTIIRADDGAPDLDAIDEQNDAAGRMIELMAGVIQAGEPPLESFRRECKEETGLSPRKVVYICSFYPSPGACSEQIHLYYGRIVWPKGKDWPKTEAPEDADSGDETEDIRLLYWTPEKFLKEIKKGSLRDGKCYAAAEWMRRPDVIDKYFNVKT